MLRALTIQNDSRLRLSYFTVQSGLKVMWCAVRMAWVGSGLMMTLLRDVERGEREETITLLSGMSARTGPGLPGSPVTARPVGPSLAIHSALDLDCDTGPGSQSRAEQLIPGPGSRVLFSLRAGPSRAGAGIARRGLDCDTGPGRAARGRPGV